MSKNCWILVLFFACCTFGVLYRATPIYHWFGSGTPDDAMYYLKPALNLATGHGSSFDQINLTNGYHPLWFAILAALYWLMGSGLSAETYTYAAMGVQILFAAGFITGLFWLLVRVSSLPWGRDQPRVPSVMVWGTALLFASNPLTYFPGKLLSLLETSVQLFVFVILLHQLLTLLERETPSPKDASALGLLAGLFFLARTDGVFLFVSVGLVLFLSFRSARLLAWYAAPCAAIALAYLGINHSVFGTAMPVSGAIKLDTSRELLRTHSYLGVAWEKLKFVLGPYDLFRKAYKVGLQLLAFLPLAALVAWRKRLRELPILARFLLAPGLFLTFKYLAYTLLYHGSRSAAYWYWVIDVVVALMLGATVAAKLLASITTRYKPLPQTILPVLLVIGFATHRLYVTHAVVEATPKPPHETTVLLDLARFMRANPYFHDKRIGSFNAGILGMFSQSRVTNLDGLSNSKEFATLVAQDRRDEYIRDTFDLLVEYHPGYPAYYTRLGFSTYNVSKYIAAPVSPELAGDANYWVYASRSEAANFERFLATLATHDAQPN